MRISKVLLVLGLMILVAGAGWAYAQRRPANKLSADDFVEIQQLVIGYTHGLDVGPEDSSWVFTSDGVFVGAGQTLTGEKQLT